MKNKGFVFVLKENDNEFKGIHRKLFHFDNNINEREKKLCLQ